MTSASLPRSSSAPLKDGIPPKELLDDLCSRFVLNVPKEDQQSFERILFLVEYAHWFYEDNSVENNPSLKSFTLKEFTSLMFNSCDVLKPYVPHIDDIFKDFTSYKVRVPVTGAIILDQTYERCVLVKGWKGTSWSFPRGKKNKDEEDDACAIREVLEETGFNVSKLINKEEYIEMTFGPQRVRLYIVGGVKDDTAFAPQTKKEISEIAWQRVDELQPANRDVISRSVAGLKLYMVSPFLNVTADHLLNPLKELHRVRGESAEGVKSEREEHVLILEIFESLDFISSAPGRTKTRFTCQREAMSLWKAKGSSSGSNLVMTETASNSNLASVAVSVSNDKGPGRSFRNFQLDSGPILQAIETAFS